MKMSDSKEQILKEIDFINQQTNSTKNILSNTQNEIDRICKEIIETIAF